MKKLFGTDGMRGEAGRFPLDAETMRATGRSLAMRLAVQTGRAPRIVLGRDTRESGAWIEDAFLSGARAAGAVCESAGVITTPGVAFLARTLPADAGIVISASHNPFQDNGIKIFAPDGRKFDEATERLIEADIYAARGVQDAEDATAATLAPPATDAGATETTRSSGVGVEGETVDAPGETTEASAALRARYLEYLAGDVARGLRLDGQSIVLDCANGASSALAPALFERLGARVFAINHTPDGRNINLDSGSLHIEGLQRKVSETRATLGVAYDGDADRALFVDAQGNLVDGDATLWVLAARMQARGELAGDAVVATVMSNLGLELALKARGLMLLRTDVGDKYVLEELLRTGATLGGEQSGHIIFPRESLAGDGLITTIQMLRALSETGRALQQLTEGFVRYPQVLVNVRVGEKRPFEEVAEIARRKREVEARLGAQGRLLLRYSGTENLARVMIEGQSQDEIEELAGSLAGLIGQVLGVN
ncbi:MAG TPA: phosphoglucosamine mutase [Pyrinomonadaceae bacterium]|nr:phosphoglucosamine mutase [Pyrinomonadaceae bacterium]